MRGVRGHVCQEDDRRGRVRVPYELGVLDEAGVGLGAGGAPFRRVSVAFVAERDDMVFA